MTTTTSTPNNAPWLAAVPNNVPTDQAPVPNNVPTDQVPVPNNVPTDQDPKGALGNFLLNQVRTGNLNGQVPEEVPGNFLPDEAPDEAPNHGLTGRHFYNAPKSSSKEQRAKEDSLRLSKLQKDYDDAEKELDDAKKELDEATNAGLPTGSLAFTLRIKTLNFHQSGFAVRKLQRGLERETKKLAADEEKMKRRVEREVKKLAADEQKMQRKLERESKKLATDEQKMQRKLERETISMPEQNGIRRPKEGTICGSIWAICDELAKHMESNPHIEIVLHDATEQGFNPATIKTQYSLWRKFSSGVTP